MARIAQRKVVVFNFAETFTRQRRARALAVMLTGVEGGLPDTYGLTPEALAELMNDWKRGVRRRPTLPA